MKAALVLVPLTTVAALSVPEGADSLLAPRVIIAVIAAIVGTLGLCLALYTTFARPAMRHEIDERIRQARRDRPPGVDHESFRRANKGLLEEVKHLAARVRALETGSE